MRRSRVQKCKGVKVAYESIEYGVSSIGDTEDTKTRGMEGWKEAALGVFFVLGSLFLQWSQGRAWFSESAVGY